jgi:hypothetical protein
MTLPSLTCTYSLHAFLRASPCRRLMETLWTACSVSAPFHRSLTDAVEQRHARTIQTLVFGAVGADPTVTSDAALDPADLDKLGNQHNARRLEHLAADTIRRPLGLVLRNLGPDLHESTVYQGLWTLTRRADRDAVFGAARKLAPGVITALSEAPEVDPFCILDLPERRLWRMGFTSNLAELARIKELEAADPNGAARRHWRKLRERLGTHPHSSSSSTRTEFQLAALEQAWANGTWPSQPLSATTRVLPVCQPSDFRRWGHKFGNCWARDGQMVGFAYASYLGVSAFAIVQDEHGCFTVRLDRGPLGWHLATVEDDEGGEPDTDGEMDLLTQALAEAGVNLGNEVHSSLPDLHPIINIK